MNRTFHIWVILLVTLSLVACKSQQQAHSDASKQGSSPQLHSFISIFELPATDLSRAISFYEAILDYEIEEIEIPGMKMGLFPLEGEMIVGVIIQGDGYVPSQNGVTIYLNAGDNLQVILDKVEKNGGKILVPKTPHGDESGYFALILDTEGNRLGLHSPN